MSPVVTFTGRDPRTSTPVTVSVRDGLILSVEEGRLQTGDWIAPGLVDLQVNGYAGFDFNAEEPSPRAVVAATRRLLTDGVTTFVPTLVTASHARIADRLVALAQARTLDAATARAIPYVHLEGPHLSDQDGPRGVHELEWVRPPSLDEFDDWQSGSGGLIGMVTLSPHYDDSADYIAALTARSVQVAIGHTHATDQQIRAAVTAGARLSTHLGNGAHTVLPRHPNYLWSQLAEDGLTAGFIADGHHLPAAALKAMIRAKGLQRSLLVSDAVSLAGCPAGEYRTPVGGHVVLDEQGRLTHVESGLLAGAARGLASGVAYAATAAGLGLADALELATVSPGRFVGGRGRLVPGGRADLILFGWQPGDTDLAISTAVQGGVEYPSPTGM